MKIIISDNAYEEYRQNLIQKTQSKKEALEQDLTLPNLLSELPWMEGIFAVSFFIGGATLLIPLFDPTSSVQEITTAKNLLIAGIAFLLAVAVTTVSFLLYDMHDIKSRIAKITEFLEKCKNLTRDEFLKYIKENHKCCFTELTTIEILQYLKGHPESILKTKVSQYGDYFYITYEINGLVKKLNDIYISVETRVDIDDDALIWDVSGIKYQKKYSKN